MNGPQHPLVTKGIEGHTWRLYSAEFDSPDGRYGFYFYAISDEHAHLQLTAIKESARLLGQVGGVVDGK